MSNTNNNTNANIIRAELFDMLRENMTALHQNFAVYNQNMREYNQNIRMMMQMTQSVRPVANPSLVNARTYTTLPINDNLYTTTRGRMTGNYINPIENLLYSTIINGLLPSTETTEQQRLTPEQISSLTRDIPYTSDISQTTCDICQEEFVENETVCQIIGCSHIFHKPELMRWLQTSNSCPICRLELTITNTEPVTERNIRTNDTSNNITNNQSRNTSREPVRNTTTNNNINQSVTESNIDQTIEDMISRFLTTTPTVDPSGTLVYTFDIPLNFSNGI